MCGQTILPEPDIRDIVSCLQDLRRSIYTLSALARKCATNTTYLNREIKDNTGGSFKELLNAKRVDYIVKELRRDPYTDLHTVFFNAGFRSRATAWRNFKTLMGVSPAEFCQSLKH